MPETNEFRNLWSVGFSRLVPIIPPNVFVSPKSALYKRPKSLGKAVGVKGQDGLWRGFDWLPHNTTDSDLDTWHSMGAGVGIRTGQGLIALDIDTLSVQLAEHVERLAVEILGSAALRIGRYPKRLMLYACEPTPKAIPYRRVDFEGYEGLNERVELLSDDRQFVAFGLHANTGKPYVWQPACPTRTAVTFVTEQQVRDLFNRLSETLPKATAPVALQHSGKEKPASELAGDPALIRKAVNALPNTKRLFPTYDDYVAVGQALRGALPDDTELAKELFLQWRGRYDDTSDPLDEETALSDWRRIQPSRVLGADWLYTMAEKHGPKGMFSKADVFFQPLPDEPDDPFAIQPAAPKPRGPLEIVSFNDAAASALTQSTSPLIEGLLDEGALSVVYGPSGVGKTYVVMDAAYHVAAGRSWGPDGSLKVTQRGVLYVAAEGGVGARKRCAALSAKYGPADDFYFRLAPVDLLRPDGDLRPLIETALQLKARGVALGLVVIDTLSRAMAGGDENSSVDMGALVKHVDALRHACGAHVLVVHHSGKDAARGARGHSLLRAATDTEIEIADGQIKATKQRDIDGVFEATFAFESRPVGSAPDGRQVVSSTISLIGRGAATADREATPAEQRVLDAVEACAAESGGASKGVRVADIVSILHGELSDTEAVKAAAKVRWGLMGLTRKGHLVQPKKGFWAKSTVGFGPYSKNRKNDENLHFSKVVEETVGFGVGDFFQ